MPLGILFHFLRTQHVSGITVPIIRSLRLFCLITNTTNLVIQHNIRKLLMMDILTLILLTWSILLASNYVSKWRMRFNSALRSSIITVEIPTNPLFAFHINTYPAKLGNMVSC